MVRASCPDIIVRLIFIAIAALLVVIQFPLWLGKGGWLRVWELNDQVAAAHLKNETLRARNAKLQSEVADLKQGTEAVEERARFELGMVRDDEVFVQVVEPGKLPVAEPAQVVAASATTPAAKASKPPSREQSKNLPKRP